MLALGHAGALYDAWLIRINDGDQFGSGFVGINPNSKIPALLDRSAAPAIWIFESGAILMYLAEKFGAFLPTAVAARNRISGDPGVFAAAPALEHQGARSCSGQARCCEIEPHTLPLGSHIALPDLYAAS